MCRKNLKLSAILKAIYEPVYKLVTEKKSLATYKMKETSHKNAFLMYYAYKAQGKFNQKDFSDKIAIFEHEGAVYVYQTSNAKASQDAEQDEIENEASSSIDRCTTYVTIQKWW